MTENELLITRDTNDVVEQSQYPSLKQSDANSMSSTKPFSFDTIEDFDEHIAKSIPNYHLLSNSIRDLSTFFLKPDTYLIDIGCSTGKLLKRIPFEGRKIGIDISYNLLPSNDTLSNIEFLQADIRKMTELPPASLVLSIFTLQFIPVPDRLGVLQLVYNSLEKGGAFIMAEKIFQPDGLFERVFTNAYYDFKRETFSTEEIMDKERDLRKLMTVQTSQANLDLAERAGFTFGEMFWKFYNFEAWLFVK